MQEYERRKEHRIKIELPIKISIGSQVTVQGHIRDISINSAFIMIGHNIFINSNDEVRFSFEHVNAEGQKNLIQGSAYVSRIVKGEGFAICFTKLDEASAVNLKKIVT